MIHSLYYKLTIVRVITCRHRYRGKIIIVIRIILCLLHVYCVFDFGIQSVQTAVWHALLVGTNIAETHRYAICCYFIIIH